MATSKWMRTGSRGEECGSFWSPNPPFSPNGHAYRYPSGIAAFCDTVISAYRPRRTLGIDPMMGGFDDRGIVPSVLEPSFLPISPSQCATHDQPARPIAPSPQPLAVALFPRWPRLALRRRRRTRGLPPMRTVQAELQRAPGSREAAICLRGIFAGV